MAVLVVGAGPTGLTAALKLADLGVECRIVERRTAPSDLSRAIGIVHSTIVALTPLGAGAAIRAEAMELSRIEACRDGRTLLKIDVSRTAFRERVIRGLPQNRTEEILRGALAERGVEVDYGVAAEGIEPEPDAATVAFSDGTRARFDWVVAADGLQSGIRQQLGIAFPGTDLPGAWSIADVDVAGEFDSNRVWVDIQRPGGHAALVLPIERHRARAVASTPDALAALDMPLQIERVRREATFRISVRQADTYHKGRVLLAGDAAHCHSPFGGKGMNLGIADALAAAEAIADGTPERYAAARHREGARVVRATERGRRLATSAHPLARGAVFLAARAITVAPGLERPVLRALMEL